MCDVVSPEKQCLEVNHASDAATPPTARPPLLVNTDLDQASGQCRNHRQLLMWRGGVSGGHAALVVLVVMPSQFI